MFFVGAGDRRRRMNLVRSRIGRAFIAIRDQDIAAEIIGINIFRYKLWAFAISSFYAGVTGVLYTYYLGHRELRAVPARRVDRLSWRWSSSAGSARCSARSSARSSSPCCRSSRAGCWKSFGGLFFSRRRAVEHHPEPAPRHVRRADHLLSGRRAGRPEPALAQYPQLLPGVAILSTEQAATREEPEMRHLTATSPGARRRCVHWRSVVRRRRVGAAEGRS